MRLGKPTDSQRRKKKDPFIWARSSLAASAAAAADDDDDDDDDDDECILFHGICNILGRRSLICMVFAMFWTLGLSFCVVFAMFWSLDSLFDWYLQRIGAGRGISELMLQKRATE